MRWKYIDKDPKEGTIRTRHKFLLLPQCIDGEWRWLERASWVEEYTWHTNSHGIYKPDWITIRWKD